MLTKRLAYELGGDGIRVNAIAPGWIRTDMTTRGRSAHEVKRIEELVKSKSALHLVDLPEHVANLVLFLVSDASAFITGEIIVKDGGRFDYLTHSV